MKGKMTECNEPMFISDFICPACGETFEEIYYMDYMIIECPYCDTVMNKLVTQE